MATMQHHLRLGPTGIRYRLSDDLIIEDFRRQVSTGASPIALDVVGEDDTEIRLWLNPATTPWWSLESASVE